MSLSSNQAKLTEPEDNHWAPSLLDNIVNIYMKIDDWSGLFKVFEFKNICKVLTKSGFIFKHQSRSLDHNYRSRHVGSGYVLFQTQLLY